MIEKAVLGNNQSPTKKGIGRKDSWSKEDDVILAELVFNHLESGSTQTKAFEEAAMHLSRTKSACGFRWNNRLRIIYEERIQETRIGNRMLSKSKSTRYGPRSTWSIEQDQQILQFVLEGIEMGRKVHDSVRLAAAYLEKNENSCMIRWTNVVRKEHISLYLEAKQRYKDRMMVLGDSWDNDKVGRVIHHLELKIHELTKEIRNMKENYVEKCDLNCFSIAKKKDEL